VSGIPPLSGFIGKVMLMQSLREARFGTAIWVALLASGLVAALVLARAASAFFWEPGRAPAAPDRPGGSGGLRGRAAAALVLLVAASPLLTLMAAPVGAYAEAAALQLHDRRSYVEAVLGPRPDIRRERRP
jgi:multicomponent K+:H+ antiporter subunit D